MQNDSNKTHSYEMSELRSCKNLISFANVLGPVSLLIGGVLMGAAGLTCAIIARLKAKRLMGRSPEIAKEASKCMKSTTVSIVICIVAIAINAVAIYIYMPVILETLQNIDLNSLLYSEYGGSGANPGVGSTSTWG